MYYLNYSSRTSSAYARLRKSPRATIALPHEAAFTYFMKYRLVKRYCSGVPLRHSIRDY
jgi:hypothetical protein